MTEKRPARHSAFEEALRCLDRRALTAKEMRMKLARFNYSPEEIEAAVAECRKHRFLDDALFAETFRDELIRSGNGTRMIRMKLLRRGVDPDVIAEKLADVSESETEACREAGKAKLRLLQRESDPRKKREKLFRFLAGRGFSAATVQKILAEYRDFSTINGTDNSLGM